MEESKKTKEAAKILVVDDVDTNRFVLRDMIQEIGHQPVLAETGEQALKLAERLLPQLIILDVAMPRMDGYEVCRILKNNVETREIPVIFISAFDDPEDMVKGFKLGGEDYITKPFIPEVVKARLRLHLKLHHANIELQEINRRIRTDVAEFLAECDENYAQRVSLAADKILSNLEHSPIVLLSGPSGSGKTTTAMKVAEELRRRGVNSHAVAMDNYFVTMNPRTAPRTPEGAIDYESPLCMDMDLLDQHFTALSRGEEILVPRFEFARQMRNDSLGTPLKLEKNEIAVFEGIHALNDDIAGRHPEATKLYISARSNINEGAVLRFKGTWMRLTRRAVRDYSFRGTGVAQTLAMWANVRRGEKLYISPFRSRADIIFDSSLPYEVPVMKNYALPILQSVPENNERHDEMLELVKAFEHFEAIDPALVAQDSLLREFIGGGSYKYH